MRLVFVRHAEPDYSIDSLTPKGRFEAELLSRRLTKLNVKAFYSSPLGRAKDTAIPTLRKLGRTAEIKPWLAEYRGTFFNEYRQRNHIPWDLQPRWYHDRPGLKDINTWTQEEAFAQGTVDAIWQETKAGLDSLLAQHGYIRDEKIALYHCEDNQEDTLVFFCHFGIATALIAHLIDISPVALWQGFCMLPSSVTTLVSEERYKGEVVWRCSQYGDISHLYVADEKPSTAAMFCECYDGRDSTTPIEWSLPQEPDPEFFTLA